MSARRRSLVRSARVLAALLAVAALGVAGLWAYDTPAAQLAIAYLWSLCGVAR